MSVLKTLDQFLKKAEDKTIKNFPVKDFLDDLGRNGVKLIRNWNEELAVIDKIIESLAARNLKKKFLDSEVFFDHLISIANTKIVNAQILTLELLNKIASNTEQRLVLRDKFQEEIGNIARQLPKLGDYEHQILILEFLIRYQVREDKDLITKSLGEDLGSKFCQISKKTFESDARPFLNAVNEKNGLIVSLPCHRAFVATREIQPPPAKGYKSLWVDFQYGSKSIRIYCKLHSLADQSGKWDSFVIDAKDIVSYLILGKKDNGKKQTRSLHKITVAKECYAMFDATTLSQFPGREVTLEFDKGLPVQQCIEKLCNHMSVTTNSSQNSTDVFEGSQKSIPSVALNQFKISLLEKTPKGLRKNLPPSYHREEREKSVGRLSTVTVTSSTYSERTTSTKKIVEKENLEAEAEKLPPAKKSKSDSKPKAPPIKSILKAKRASNGPTWKNNYSFRKPTTSKEKVTKTKKKEEVYKYEKRDIFDDLSSSGSSIGSFKAFRVKKKVEKTKNGGMKKLNIHRERQNNSLPGPSDSSFDSILRQDDAGDAMDLDEIQNEKIEEKNKQTAQTPIGDKVLNISEKENLEAEAEKLPPAKKSKSDSKPKAPPIKSILKAKRASNAMDLDEIQNEKIEEKNKQTAQTPIGDKVLNISETPKTRAQRTPLRSIRKHTQKSPKINLPNELNLAEFIEALGLQVNPNRNRLRKLFQELRGYRIKVDETLMKIEQELDA